jgi:transcriptional regulator with XRE-family HTH domain
MKPKVEAGEKLRLIRTKRKVSQAELADAIFVKNTTISNWEKGTRKIQTDNLKALSEFFGVPVSYFLESDEKKESWRKVPMKTLLAGSAGVAMLVSLTVVALNGRANLNNEACYGELVCYLIDDPSIVSELSSRNISGGLMTNVEMEKLKFFLETYTLGSEAHQFNYKKLSEINLKQYYMNFPSETVEIHANLESLVNDFHNPNLHSPFPNLAVFNLDITNPFDNQLFYMGSGFNLEKHIIYKVSADVFKYEIYSTQQYIFNIQLELNTIYFADKSYVSPKVIYDYFAENYPFESVFETTPFQYENESTVMNVNYLENNDGLYIMQSGFYYYMKDHPIYELMVPFFSIQHYPNHSSKTYFISAGHNGGYEDFSASVSFGVNDYGLTSLVSPISGGSISYRLNEDRLGESLTLQEWLDWTATQTIFHTDLNNQTVEETFIEIFEVFDFLLDQSFQLDAIIY